MRNSGNSGPSRAWFILPSVLLFAGGLLAAIGISSFVGFVRSDLRSYQPDSSISVTTDGFTLYAEDWTTGAAAPLFLGLSSVVLFAVLAFMRYRSRTKSAAVG